jgi:molecular chaperone DnaK
MNQQIRNSEVVGIDLGTTFTVVAFWDETGQPKIIPNLDGELKTASVVYCGKNGGEILVGTPALSMLFVEPERTVKEMKRDVGTDKVYFGDGSLRVTPECCQAEVLKFIRKAAIQYFGDKRAASQAVITVPAYFTEKERQSVQKSADLAGIGVLQLINEPTAAGLAFGLTEKQGDFLVILPDFGGGTFDVSLIKYSGGKAEVLATSGDKHLGGKDVDNILLEMVREKFKQDYGIDVTPEACPADYYSIWEEVIRQKHLLSSKREVRLIARAEGKQVVMDITRDQLNQSITPLIDRIKKITLDMLADAQVSIGDVKHVVSVGGSSRLSLFRETFKDMFGEDALIGGRISPDLAVAAGAVTMAIKIVSKGKNVVNEHRQVIPTPAIQSSDVMSHSLGIAVQDRVSGATFCSVILKKNTPIPCRASRFYASLDESQTKFQISVVQGEDGRPISDCLIVAEEILDLPARDPNKESVEVEMGYDESGMVKVVVKDLISNQQRDITVDFYARKS